MYLNAFKRPKNYSASIINGREFKKSQETLNSKAKSLRYQGKGKRPNRAQTYSREDEEEVLPSKWGVQMEEKEILYDFSSSGLYIDLNK